jgi:hypothetical protein
MEKPSKKILFQRKHPRVELDLKGDFRIPTGEADSKFLSTVVKMLGCGGLMFESSIPLAKGTRLEMNLFYKNEAIPFTGEIVWADSPNLLKNSEFKCGMRFLTISHNNLLNVHYILYTHLFKPKIKSKKIAILK